MTASATGTSTHSAATPLQLDRLQRLLLFLLPIVACWIFLPTLANPFHLKNHLVAGGCLLLFLGWLADPRAALPVLPAYQRLALLLWLAVLPLSVLAARHPLLAWRGVLEYLPLLLLLPVLLDNARRPDVRAALQTGILLAALGVALLCLQQGLWPSLWQTGLSAPGKLRVFSSMGNPNWAAIVMVVALPFAAPGALVRQRCWPGVLAVLLLLVALLLTRSREALLAVLLMAGLALSLRVDSHRRRQLLWLSLVLLLLSPLLLFVEALQSALHSLHGRFLIQQAGWQMMLDHALTGVGFGHAGWWYPDYQAALLSRPGGLTLADNAAVIDEVHNEFLQWGVSTGLLGFAGFTVLCLGVLWQSWRDAVVRPQRLPWCLAWAGLLFTLLFTGIQPYSALGLLLVSCLGVLMPAAEERREIALGRGVRVAAALFAAVILYASASWAWQDLHADHAAGDAARHMQERDAWLARLTYEQALAIDPWHPGVRKDYATTLYLERRYDEALQQLEQAAQISGDTGIRLLQGEILARLGRDDEAVALYRQLVAAYPGLLTPRFVLAQLYARQHRNDLAREQLRQVLTIRPSAYNRELTQAKVKEQKKMAQIFLRRLENSGL